MRILDVIGLLPLKGLIILSYKGRDGKVNTWTLDLFKGARSLFLRELYNYTERGSYHVESGYKREKLVTDYEITLSSLFI